MPDAASTYLNHPIRTYVEAARDAALAKARDLTRMSADELASLTVDELTEIAARAMNNQEVLECNSQCYVNGGFKRVHELSTVRIDARLEIARRADAAKVAS